MFKSIRVKLILSCLMLLIVVVGMLATLFYQYEYRNLEDVAIGRSMEVNRLQTEYLGTIFNQHINPLMDLASNESTLDLNQEMILQRLKKLRDNPNYLYFNTFFIDDQGGYMTPSGETGATKDHPYIIKLMNQEVDYIISKPHIGGARGVPVIVFAANLQSDGEYIGSVCGSVELKDLSKVAEKNLLLDISYGWIIDREGLIVAHPDPEYSMKLNVNDAEELGFVGFDILWVEIQTRANGYGEYYDSNIDQAKILTYYDIPSSPGWKLMITTKKDEIYAPMLSLRKQLIWISTVVVFMSALAIWAYANKLIKPLLKLTETVKKSSNSDVILIDEVESKDEIGTLIMAYNEMGKTLNDYTQNLEQRVKDRTEELDRLNKMLYKQNAILENQNHELYTLATTDKLTGLLNRAHIYEQISLVMDGVDLGSNRSFVLLFIDIDNFKYYNDTFGHDAGDVILVNIANFFKEKLRATDIIGRYGGDEFIVIIPDGTQEQAEIVVSKIACEFKALDDYKALLEAGIPSDKLLDLSVGIAFYDRDHSQSMDDLIKLADSEMYKVKRNKKTNTKYSGLA